jgi:hypothetical protein
VEKMPCAVINLWGESLGADDFQSGDNYSIRIKENYGFNFQTGEWTLGGPLGYFGPNYLAMRSFVDAGLMIEEKGEYFEQQNGQNPYQIFIYKPKPEYVSYFSEKASSNGNPEPAFCLGKGKVTEIINFTIPQENGLNTSLVRFQWKSDASPDLLSRSTSLKLRGRPETGGASEATLMLTNNGWEMKGQY